MGRRGRPASGQTCHERRTCPLRNTPAVSPANEGAGQSMKSRAEGCPHASPALRRDTVGSLRPLACRTTSPAGAPQRTFWDSLHKNDFTWRPSSRSARTEQGALHTAQNDAAVMCCIRARHVPPCTRISLRSSRPQTRPSPMILDAKVMVVGDVSHHRVARQDDHLCAKADRRPVGAFPGRRHQDAEVTRSPLSSALVGVSTQFNRFRTSSYVSAPM